jgi:hypothetical protein
MSTQAESVILLGVGGSKSDNMSTHGTSKLDSHVSKSTNADNTNSLASGDLPVAQRRVCSDTGTQQGSSSGKVQVLGDAKNEVLVNNNAVRVATLSDSSEMLIDTTVSPYLVVAVVLVANLAVIAGQVGVDQAANSNKVTNLELGDLGANLGNATNDLVSRDNRVLGVAPLTLGCVNVGVANSTELNVDLNVCLRGLTTSKIVGTKRGSRAGSGVGLGSVGSGHLLFWLFFGFFLTMEKNVADELAVVPEV